MRIKIRYDNQTMTLDVPEEDCTVMIQLDYEKRRAEAADPEAVQRRTPQEIFDESFNRPEYNNWHTYWRHIDEKATPPSVFGGKQHLSSDLEEDGEEHHFTMDEFPDLAALENQKTQERDQELRAWIRKKLKPDYAEMLIAICMDGISITDYAAQIGETRSAVSHRLQRAEKRFVKIFGKRPVLDSPVATPWEEKNTSASQGGE